MPTRVRKNVHAGVRVRLRRCVTEQGKVRMGGTGVSQRGEEVSIGDGRLVVTASEATGGRTISQVCISSSTAHRSPSSHCIGTASSMFHENIELAVLFPTRATCWPKLTARCTLKHTTTGCMHQRHIPTTPTPASVAPTAAG
jgi:hypothetical protein